MIPDWKTNRLFVSDRLEQEFLLLLTSLRSALQEIPIDTISGTADIWCRDYMPIQLTESSFCQFVYQPDYLEGFEHLITDPNNCRLPFMKHIRQEPIVLDGGNVVASRTKVILTEKVYTENPTFKRPQLRERLEQIFQAGCIFIPKQAGDVVGHSDGVVRFIAENRVLLNNYSLVDPGYGERVRMVLEKNGLEVEPFPMFEEDGGLRHGDLPPGIGIYINFLRVGNVVILPGFDHPKDKTAVERTRQILPEAEVFQVPCRPLAEKGGALNCISWTIKDETVGGEG